jgi:glucokinase
MHIGIDLGGTKIKIGLVNEAGCITDSISIDTAASHDYETIMRDMTAAIRQLLKQNNLGPAGISSIGIGVPGLVDYEKGRVIYCANLSWYDVDVSGYLGQHFKVPVYLENDATAAAYAESLFGSTRDVSSSVFLTIGTGIGGGIIIDNQIIRGGHGAASEIGHMVVGENFYDCNCGRNGCFETFASATAMIKYAMHRLEKPEVASSLRNIIKEKGGLEAKDIFDQAAAGDKMAVETVDRTAKYLAIGIVNIYNILDPELIAIGGGVSKAGKQFFDKVSALADKMTLSKHVKYAKIVIAELGNDAGIIGAAFLGKQA